MVNNSKEQLKCRKAEDLLIIVGRGILMLTVWSALKLAGILILRKDEIIERIETLQGADAAELSADTTYLLVILFAVLLMACIIAVRSFVAFSSIGTGMGKTHYLYMPITIILILSSLSEFLSALNYLLPGGGFMPVNPEQFSYTPASVALIIEFTSMVMMIEMLAAGIRVARYRSKIKNKNKRKPEPVELEEMEIIEESGITGE